MPKFTRVEMYADLNEHPLLPGEKRRYDHEDGNTVWTNTSEVYKNGVEAQAATLAMRQIVEANLR